MRSEEGIDLAKEAADENVISPSGMSELLDRVRGAVRHANTALGRENRKLAQVPPHDRNFFSAQTSSPESPESRVAL